VAVIDNKKCGSSVSNFMQLTSYATADYVMYCDQDDYWLPNKIEVTLKKMVEIENGIGNDKPILVFSTYRAVDCELNDLQLDESKNQIASYNLELNGLLVQNCVTGCLMMISRKLCDMAGDYNESILMHDWWLAIIASAMGEICHIPFITMLYRQHGNNVVGVVNVKSVKYRWMKFTDKKTREQKDLYRMQAQLLLDRFALNLSNENRRIVEQFLAIYTYKSKIKRVYHLIKGKYLKSDLIRCIGQVWYI
jgi:glycosyltransferase involved in cell wall biosynthesis